MNEEYQAHIEEVVVTVKGLNTDSTVDRQDIFVSHMILKLREIKAQERIADNLEKIYNAMNHT